MTDPVNLSRANLLEKWRFYSHRYGVLHAICSYMGRYSPRFWRAVGPRVTSACKRRWIDTIGRKILNLGSGGNCIPGCLNVDIDARADCYVDIERPLLFDEESIDAIFCEEVIEHLERDKAVAMLGECLRILRAGGAIRLTTPDPDSPSRGAGHGHKHIFAKSELVQILQHCGFVNVRESFYRDGASALGYLDSHAERFSHSPDISIYYEAEKRNQGH